MTPSPSRRGPRPQYKGTRTIAFWGTEDDLYAIKRLARLLNRRGRYSQSDVIRVALRRLCASTSSRGTGWLKAEIDILKEEESLAAKDGIGVSLPDDSLIADGGLGIRHDSPSRICDRRKQ